MGMGKLISINDIVVKTLNSKTSSYFYEVFVQMKCKKIIAVTFDVGTLILCFKTHFAIEYIV